LAGQGTVTIKVLGDVANVKRAFAEVGSGIDGVESKARGLGSKLQSLGGTLTKSVTLPIVGALGLMTNAAAEEEEKMAVLATLLKNTTGATQDQVDANEEWITSMQNATGVADDDLRVAMGKLLVAGRSVEQSHKDLAVAADIAAARHIPLETVVNAMAKAAQGSTGALSKLGIQTKDAAGEALSYDQILQNASKTMGGAAATAADTAAGRMEIMKLKMADVAEKIGSALLPLITKLADWLGKLADWFTDLSPGMQQAVLIFALIAAAIGPVIGVVGSLVTAIGFLISPIGLVILAVAALALGVYYAYTHFEGFREVVDNVASWLMEVAWPTMQTVFESIVAAAQEVITFVQDHWEEISTTVQAVFDAIKSLWDNVYAPVLKAIIAAYAEVIMFIVDHWDQIRAAFQLVFDAIGIYWNNVVVPFYQGLMLYIQTVATIVATAFDVIRITFETVWNAASTVWDTVGAPIFDKIVWAVTFAKDTIETVLGTIKGAFQTAWDVVTAGWNLVKQNVFDPIVSILGTIKEIAEKAMIPIQLLLDAKDAIGGLLGGGGGLIGPGFVPQLPGSHKAMGGAVSAAMPYLVGERGPELFVPGASGSIVSNHKLGGNTFIFQGTFIGDEAGMKRAVTDALAMSV